MGNFELLEMHINPIKAEEKIKQIWFENERIYMRSTLDKTYSRPLEVFPILKDASAGQREAYEISEWGDSLRWPEIDEDIHISSFFDSKEPKYDNEVAALFSRFPQLNVSEIAKLLGIHKSLLSQYIYGVKTPSEKRMNEIRAALHDLGVKLIEATA